MVEICECEVIFGVDGGKRVPTNVLKTIHHFPKIVIIGDGDDFVVRRCGDVGRGGRGGSGVVNRRI